MNQFCTIGNMDYLDQVLALDESRRTWCGEFPLHILILDEYSSHCLEELERLGFTTNIKTWHWTSVVEPELAAARRNRSYHEWIWTVKPYWILHLMRNLPKWDGLTYIDGDMEFFNHPASLFFELQGHDIGITPHRFSKSYSNYLVNGEFNGAFVHVKNTKNALSCITHWAGQCLRRCSLQHAEGSFVDQKYLNAWPDRWRAHGIQHKGVNLAPYNQGEGHYSYSFGNGGRIFVDATPLVLYHFHSGLTPGYPLDPFIQEHVYDSHAKALEEARRTIEQCAS